MAEEIFHTMRSTGRTFTQQQWHEYLDGIYHGDWKPLTAKFGEFVFNDHDICLNPEKHHVSVKDGCFGYYVDLSVAECGNGLWSFGLSYSVGTAGGGFGVSWADSQDGERYQKSYPSRKECLQAACDYVICMLDTKSRKRDAKACQLQRKVQEYKKEMTRPKVVQLELF